METAELYSLSEPAPASRFLARYRRCVARPLADAYIAAWSAPGDLVLDPFCQDATVLLAAAAAGRRAIALTGNPLLALLARVEAAPPDPADLEAALRRLGAAPKVDTPLGDHLDRLYASSCPHCHASVPAAAFIWEHGAPAPQLCEIACPRCHHVGREPLDPAAAYPPVPDAQGFARRFIAERLRTAEDHHRLQEHLLELYTPRNLYALTVLLIKIEVLFAESPLLDPLRTALLHTLDAGSKLNLATEEGWRPMRSLAVPRRFREANVWQVFSAAVHSLAARPRPPAVALAGSPELVLQSPPGAICIAGETLARLAARWPGRVALALSGLPRFDPTFAALSYFWSGWLFDKEGARAAEHLLRQRSPDESRYLRALQSALGALRPVLAEQGYLALTFEAPGTFYVETLLAAAASAGLAPLQAWHGLLDDRPAEPLAVRRVEHHLVFARASAAPVGPAGGLERARDLAAHTAADILRQRAEPAPFGGLHGPIWVALAREGLLSEASEDRRRGLEAAVGQGLQQSCILLPVAPSSAGEPEQGLWWLSSPPAAAVPLADRTEASVRSLLLLGRPLAEPALIGELLPALPPPLTPSWPLLRACLETYGTRLASGEWALAEEERPAQVQARRERMLGALAELGSELGYAPARAEGCDLAWLAAAGPALAFLLPETAALAPLHAPAPQAGLRRILVIPTRHVALWRHKLRAVPPWAAELERRGYSFLREAALFQLLAEPPDPARFAAALGLASQPKGAGGQLALFD